MNTAFERGRNDKRDKRKEEACPYPRGTLDAMHWQRGWKLQDGKQPETGTHNDNVH